MPPRRICADKKLPSPIAVTESESSEEGFTMEEELLWCIKKLEACLQSESITPKILKSTVLALKTLKNSKAPVVKKRQVMRMSCGDYRKAMTEELKKANAGSKKVSLLPVKDTKSGSVINTKKLQDSSDSKPDDSSDSKFCFNFPLQTDEELRLDFQQLNIEVQENSEKENEQK